MMELEAGDYEHGMRSLAAIARRGAKFPAPASGAPSSGMMNVCVICGNMWQRAESRPDRCPSCRSTMWNRRDLHRHICKACSHRWVSASESPKRCPSCHTRNWDTDMKRYECLSCGHKAAYPMGREGPSECPRCGSAWGCDRVCCSCRRCGFVGSLMPGRQGKCPLCGTMMSSDSKPVGVRPGRIIVDSKAVEILCNGSDESSCVRDLMSEIGATETEARAMYLLCSGSGEVDAARKLNVSFDYVRRVSMALSDHGATRRGAYAPV